MHTYAGKLSLYYDIVHFISMFSVEENELFNFSGLRLDWYRLQAYTSVSKSSFMIRDHRDLAKHMNTIIFHAKMVDFLDELLVETSNLSIYWLVPASGSEYHIAIMKKIKSSICF